jgi:hypothetical protein
MTDPQQIGAEALIPNLALQPLAFLVGTWRTTGTHPMMPDTVFHGRTSFGWHEGGAFLIMRSEIDEPEIPSGVAIIGSDDGAGSLFMSYFDERGVSRKYDVETNERRMTWRRETPKFSQILTITADPGGDRMQAAGRMSRNRAEWEEDLSLTYDRISDSAPPVL